MSERIVVCFYACGIRLKLPEQANHLQHARELLKRGAARGGSLVAWGARSLAFDFEFDALEDAIELCVEVARESELGYGVGLAQGDQEPLDETALLGGTAAPNLGWGPALVRAEVLARIATPGDVLVDTGLDAIRTGELLTQGLRVQLLGRERVRGYRLDLAHPWRSSLLELMAQLRTPLAVGQPELKECLIPEGNFVVLRAERGVGGSRYLGELAHYYEPARVLRVHSSADQEPLGAIRRGLLQARSRGHAPSVLAGSHAEALESLLAGEGLDTESCAGLLNTWLAPAEPELPHGVILVDDVHQVDIDSLIAIRVAFNRGKIALVARARPGEPIPEPLADLTVHKEVQLARLSVDESVHVVRGWFQGSLDDAVAESIAEVAGGVPLAIAEALADALETGDLILDKSDPEKRRLVFRARPSSPRSVQTADYWITRRARHLEPGPRAVLLALAILGGEADSADIRALATEKSVNSFDFDVVVKELLQTRWLRKVAPELLGLPSTTHRDALLALLGAQRLRSWQRRAAECLAKNGQPLSTANAAVLALLGGSAEQAMVYARRASALARAADLSGACAALDEFSEALEPASLAKRDPALWLLSDGLSVPPSRGALNGSGGAGPASVAPQNGFSTNEIATAVARPYEEVLGSLTPPRLPGADVLAFATGGSTAAPYRRYQHTIPFGYDAATGEELLPDSDLESEHPQAEEVNSFSVGEEPNTLVRERVALRATQLLRAGDWEAASELIIELRIANPESPLAERLEALVRLGKGQASEALSSLRRAAEAAKNQNSADRCRAALSHAIGLSAAGRPKDALLEALSGLAFARELDDKRGEHACARFIAQLSEAVGKQRVAEEWSRFASGALAPELSG